MFGDNLERIVAAIEKNYEADEIFFTKPGRRFPSRTAIKGLITELRRVLFPGYFGPEMLSPSTSPSYFIGQTLIDIESVLRQQLLLLHAELFASNFHTGADEVSRAQSLLA